MAFKVPHNGNHFHGVVKGFVGKWDHRKYGCILSLADPFGGKKEGLSILEQVHGMAKTGLGKRCPGCKISKIVKHAYDALKQPLHRALKVGCVATADSPFSRRLAVTGHGIGAPIASLAAFDLANGTGYTKGSFGVECSFNFGSPRLGNDKWVQAFHARLGGSIDRITHHEDPYVDYPPKDKGFVHDDGEIFFKHAATSDPDSYVRCTEGDNPKCPRYDASAGILEDHIQYMQPVVDKTWKKKAVARQQSLWCELPISQHALYVLTCVGRRRESTAGTAGINS